MYPSAQNIVLGAGRVFFDELTDEAAGEYAGELYIGDTPGFTVSLSNESVQVYSSDGPVAEELINVTTQVSRSASLELRNITEWAWSAFVQGEVSEVETTAGAKTAQPINGGVGVRQGLWYRLGVGEDHPTGVRNVSAVAIKSASPASTYDVDDDYLLDAENARVYIVPGGGIANDTVITSDHTLANATWSQVATNDAGPKRGRLIFIADNTKGRNRDMLLSDCQLAASGDFAMKSRSDVQQMAFEIKIGKPANGAAAIYVNGRPA
jgi:hypothetical protein